MQTTEEEDILHQLKHQESDKQHPKKLEDFVNSISKPEALGRPSHQPCHQFLSSNGSSLDLDDWTTKANHQQSVPNLPSLMQTLMKSSKRFLTTSRSYASPKAPTALSFPTRLELLHSCHFVGLCFNRQVRVDHSNSTSRDKRHLKNGRCLCI